MGEIAIKIVGCICLTVICCFLIAFGQPELAAFVALGGLAIIFEILGYLL